ncbi:protein FAR1-RELATED SEQUENCE 6-like [Arachis ipaensis]|uniref:protein FAR1-RELATED SEQUENCE 6-like n=1 Tax=Arachis ipaensis TaxID=130454 RepID=UPI0007AF7CDF|nr:protein FAR1-RELATED SEQUENCE 6-like [Arachis ipaensis]
MDYFKRMKERDNRFYYDVDYNKECQIIRILFADLRRIASYEYFGDVVSFDTTYLTNKYDMPFAAFVKVNYNRKALRHIRHRWCLWHLMKKVREKLKGYGCYKEIQSKRIFRGHSTITSCYMVDHRLPYVKHYDRLRDHFSKVVKVVLHSEQYNDLLHNLLKEFCVGLSQNILCSDCGASFNCGGKGVSECGRVETDANLIIHGPKRLKQKGRPSKARKILTFECEFEKCNKHSLKTHVESNSNN